MKTQKVAGQNNYKSQYNKEMLAGTALGGLIGYGAKFAIPCGSHEYDTYVTNIIKNGIRDQVEGARAEEYRIVSKEFMNSTEGPQKAVEFLKTNKADIIHGEKDVLKAALEKLDDSTKNTVKELLKRVDNNGHRAAHIAEGTTEAAVKYFRPAALFIIVGIALAASVVTLKNSLVGPSVSGNKGFSKIG